MTILSVFFEVISPKHTRAWTAIALSADCTVQSADCARFPDCTEHSHVTPTGYVHVVQFPSTTKSRHQVPASRKILQLPASLHQGVVNYLVDITPTVIVVSHPPQTGTRPGSRKIYGSGSLLVVSTCNCMLLFGFSRLFARDRFLFG